MLRDVFENLFSVPDVISPGQNFDARREQLLGNSGRNAEACGGVLAGGDHQVDLARLHNVGQPVGDNFPARRTHDVPYKQNFHLLSMPGPAPARRLRLWKDTLPGNVWLHKKWSGPLRRVKLDPEPPVKSGRPAPAFRLSRSEPKSAAGHAHGSSDSGTRRFSIGSKDRRFQHLRCRPTPDFILAKPP